nr:hypothetical protein B0A51_00895 [Rachicladosporium sp. CCFEE 5018]
MNDKDQRNFENGFESPRAGLSPGPYIEDEDIGAIAGFCDAVLSLMSSLGFMDSDMARWQSLPLPIGVAQTPSLISLYKCLWGPDWKQSLERVYRDGECTLEHATRDLLAAFFLYEIVSPGCEEERDGYLPAPADEEVLAATVRIDDKHRGAALRMLFQAMNVAWRSSSYSKDSLKDMYEQYMMEICCETFRPFIEGLRSLQQITGGPSSSDWEDE